MTAPAPIKLSELSRKIEEVFNQAFSQQTYWVIAEVSGHKFYPNQDRHYFDLVEKLDRSDIETAKIKAKSWTVGSQRIAQFEAYTGQKFTTGLQVLIQVKIEYHIIYGLSLLLLDIDPAFTMGNIEKIRRETLQRLLSDNAGHIERVNDEFITTNKKQKLPFVIQYVALVGSPNSEGVTDFLHTIHDNQFDYKFKIDHYFTAVQGVEAAGEIVQTLIAIYNSQRRYDAVVIVRGGGAKSDFLVFDTYLLARAVARFPIPIITGIGHHKDVSIVDLMAHTQTKTPTKAAECLIARNRQFEDEVLRVQKLMVIRSQQALAKNIKKINDLKTGIINNAGKLISHHKELANVFNQNIINASRKVVLRHHKRLHDVFVKITTSPVSIINKKKNAVDNTHNNIKSFTRNYLAHQHNMLAQFISLYKMISPANILKKGFAIVSQEGRILKDANDVQVGSEIIITLHDTDLNTIVKSKDKSNGRFDL